MKPITTLFTSLVLAIFLVGCSGSEQKTTRTKPADDSKVLATVNDDQITVNAFDSYLKQRQSTAQAQNETRQQILEELINYRLLTQDAENKNIDQEQDIAQQIVLSRQTILASAAIRDYALKNPIPDEELRKDYEERISRLNLSEYNLRHTLSENEEDAKSVIAELQKGKTFEEVAKKFSKDSSAADGGSLGWLGEQDMVPGFREAAIALEKGKYSAPVQTEYGWHVIYLEDKRESPPPAFETVREQVKTLVQRKQIQDYIVGLRQAAKVDIMEENFPKPPVQSDKAADPNTGSPLKSEINLDNRY